MTFQAGLTVIEVGFKEEEEDDDPKPLRMEHFYFPLGALLIGLLLSVFCCIVEIIYLRKSKTDVPRAELEEPGVTEAIPEEEGGHKTKVENIEDTQV